MANTYNYLRTVFQNLRQANNPAFFFVVLVLWCIPLPYKYNSMALVALCVYTLFTFRKRNFKVNANLLLPIALFALMALSLVWTRDTHASLRALSKGLPLLLVPICFVTLPSFTKEQLQKIIRYYSYGVVFFTVFCLLKSAIRFAFTQNPNVFFYHELVTEDINAVHVSAYVAIAIFYFICQSSKSKRDKAVIALLSVFLILLSSKNIIIVFFGLLTGYYIWHFNSTRKRKILSIGTFSLLLLLVIFSAKIRDRIWIELDSNSNENSLNYDIGTNTAKVYNVSMKRAWTDDTFRQNDFFPGTAFRVYQIRIFKEMLQEDSIFLTGYGLNASDFRIAEKRIEHQLYEGYEHNNFHNEYVQIFAELGVFGLLLLLVLVIGNMRNALKSKDFVHISFAVLMISLFLTESFLSRQRGIVFFTIMYCLFNAGNESARLQNQ